MTDPVPSLAEKIQRIETMRELYACFYCDAPLQGVHYGELVLVPRPNNNDRIAHRVCPAEVTHAA